MPLESNISATGVLTSHPIMRDVKIEKFAMSFHNMELIIQFRILGYLANGVQLMPKLEREKIR